MDSINKKKSMIPVRMDKHHSKLAMEKAKNNRKVLSEGDLHEEYQYDQMDGGNIYEHEDGYRAD